MEHLNKVILQIKNAIITKPDIELVLYCRTLFTKQLIIGLAKHDICPLCVCDENPDLHGTLYEGLDVMSIDSAKEKFGKFLIYIANIQKLYEIIHKLEEKGIDGAEQIINYSKLSKRRGCYFLTGRCVVVNNNLHFCCGDTDKLWQTPSVRFTGDYNKLVNDFIDLRDKTMNELEEGITNLCSDCRMVKDVFVPLSYKISSITDGRFFSCNFNCVYCCSIRDTEDNNIDLPTLIKTLEDKNLIDDNANVYYSNGEITVYKGRNEIYRCLERFTQNKIFTNALLYSPEISKLMQTNTDIMVSMDAGTPETFYKIKGVDAWERVCKTLRRYKDEASGSAIELKYIFLPGLNDNKTDIEGFFDLVSEIKPGRIFISSDYTHPELINEHTIEMARYFYKSAKNLKIPLSCASQVFSEILNISYTT